MNEYSVLILLTNICNLNCTGCSAMCYHYKDSPWFITKENFKLILLKIKEIFPNYSMIDLVGGEPLLHPDFLELCEIAHSVLPDTIFQVWTNTILLSSFSDKQLQKIKQYNVQFSMSIYPPLIDNCKQIEKNLRKNNINFNYQGVRYNFNKFTFDLEGKNNIIKQYQSCFHLQDPAQYVIYKEKIFSCCMIAHMSEILNLPLNSRDYINIKDIQNFEQVHTLLEHPLNMCKYCDTGKCENYLWNNSENILLPFNKSLKDIYLSNYVLYEKITNDKNIIIKFKEGLKDLYFLSHLEEYNGVPTLIHYIRRLKNGKKDILILFDQNITFSQIYVLKEIILQRYLDCNIYFMSINNDILIEDIFYTLFEPFSNENISFWFFKAKNEKEGENKFLNNSYLQNKEIINCIEILS